MKRKPDNLWLTIVAPAPKSIHNAYTTHTHSHAFYGTNGRYLTHIVKSLFICDNNVVLTW